MSIDTPVSSASDCAHANRADVAGSAASSRRKLLASLPGVLAGSLPALALGAVAEEELHAKTHAIIERANAKGLPDTLVTTHRNARVMFHRDLVQDRVVLINFMSIAHEAEHAACANVARLIAGLGECFGREVFAISVSYDADDTPQRLSKLAQHLGAPKGWEFVTASAEDVITVGYKLYRAQGRPQQHMHGNVIHYGNAKQGLWGSMSSAIVDVPLAVTRVRSVMPAGQPEGAPRRAGPPPIGRDLLDVASS